MRNGGVFAGVTLALAMRRDIGGIGRIGAETGRFCLCALAM